MFDMTDEDSFQLSIPSLSSLSVLTVIILVLLDLLPLSKVLKYLFNIPTILDDVWGASTPIILSTSLFPFSYTL